MLKSKFSGLVYIPLIVFLVIWAHGSFIGLTDDEAYDWIMGRHLDWAYAYHPPMTAWMIAFSEKTLGWLLGLATPAVVRFPAALTLAIMSALVLIWLKSHHVLSQWKQKLPIILSLPGLFALSWMMVPDIPLFLGWTLLFVCSWRICFHDSGGSRENLTGIFLGVIFTLLGKYSGVLAVFSTALCFILFLRKKQPQLIRRALGVLCFGFGVGLLPILIWNANHGWESILYQMRDRHQGGSFSFIRYFRFWAIQIFAMGFPVIIYFFGSIKRYLKNELDSQVKTLWTFGFIWVLPPSFVYLLQPIWADFKPHWTLVIWWPTLCILAVEKQTVFLKKLSRIQVVYSSILTFFVFLSCYQPIVFWTLKQFNKSPDMKLDVTGDLYGWNRLPQILESDFNFKEHPIPVVGSRYQTAAQAAFALNDSVQVTLLPRELKAKDEWSNPKLENGQNLSDTYGPDWPKMNGSFIYVADGRYQDPPHYPNTTCGKRLDYVFKRGQFVAKEIYLWLCKINGYVKSSGPGHFEPRQ